MSVLRLAMTGENLNLLLQKLTTCTSRVYCAEGVGEKPVMMFRYDIPELLNCHITPDKEGSEMTLVAKIDFGSDLTREATKDEILRQLEKSPESRRGIVSAAAGESY
jgi:hypothetical protein